jgi:pseudouridine-5'-phosphate glycosidase
MDGQQMIIASRIREAIKNGIPVVALETAVLTHGLPYPQNIELACTVEKEITSKGATPATIGILNGKLHIGLDQDQMLAMARSPNRQKISSHNISSALIQNWIGGTTVAATLIASRLAGIRIFSTGGIGGIHRGHDRDISADLPELAKSPVIVVCSGPKAILDLSATVETLETLGVPLIGFQTNELPAFYSRESGLQLQITADSPDEIAEIARCHWQLGLQSAILVANPPPAEVSLPAKEVEKVIAQALLDAEQEGIHGPASTPFLLQRLAEITHGETLKTNLALLVGNARLAARIAIAYSKTT